MRQPDISSAGNPAEEILTVEDLERLRVAAMENSARAVSEKPGDYRAIRCLLCRVANSVLDVEDYLTVAVSLVSLLTAMGPGTIFYEYFRENLDPRKSGRAEYFRAECRDLLRRCEDLDDWRRQRRHLRLVKG